MELVSGCHVARAAQKDLYYLGGRKKQTNKKLRHEQVRTGPTTLLAEHQQLA